MKVTYIGHSGFLLETEEINFLFDYSEGEIPILEKEKPLVVFVSHSHHSKRLFLQTLLSCNAKRKEAFEP